MKLYIYEHCPFCVMAKMIFAIKEQSVDIEYLLYDNIQTPMQMTGRKLLPILEYQSGRFMPESKDIIQYIDRLDHKPLVILPENQEITNWVASLERFIYRLTYPRWIKAPFPEFSSDQAKKYFLQSKDPSGKGFTSDLADPALKQRAQILLDQLENILQDYPQLDAISPLSYSDFSLFAQLRSLSIVADLEYGLFTDQWRQQVSELYTIPLHDEFAI